MDTKIKAEKRQRRHKRIRASVFGTEDKPRLSIFRSNRYITAQLINDKAGFTLASATSKGLKSKTAKERALEVGAIIAKTAKEKKISKVVFDRGGYLYTGSVALVAEGARGAGLEF